MCNSKFEKGIHLYVNIKKFEDIVNKNTNNDKDIKRFLHMINTYQISVVKLIDYIKKDDNDIYLEKLTAGRLHIVFKENESFVDNMLIFCNSVYRLTYNVYNDFNKYLNVSNFNISIGADYGRFYNIVFNDNDYKELTSVGNCANKAAKITQITPNFHLSISNKIYDLLPKLYVQNFREMDSKKYDNISKKYSGVKFYLCDLSKLSIKDELNLDNEKKIMTEAYNRENFADIYIEGVKKKLDFSELNIKKVKKFDGIALYSDVNGFTKMFMENDKNLDDMIQLTEEILHLMNDIVTEYGGLRVQFQGDRISALFHNHSEYDGDVYLNTILAAMQLVEGVETELRKDTLKFDKFKMGNVSLSVGASYGMITATRIGIGNKEKQDNIIIGETVYRANLAEDVFANRKEIVIHKSIYDNLFSSEDAIAMKSLFTKINNGADYYKTRSNKKDYAVKKSAYHAHNIHNQQERPKPYYAE